MYVIAFANPKGGTGKTTSAVLLAEQLASAAGRVDAVGILDCDPNQNVVTWDKQRAAEGKGHPFSVYPRPPEAEVVDTIDALEGQHDFLIVDLEGTAAQIVTFALSRTDFVLIPFSPSPMEARQAARAVGLVRATSRMLKREIPCAMLFNRTNAAFKTSDEKDVRAELANSGVNVLPVSLVARAAYTRIFREAALLSELSDRDVSNLKAAVDNARAYAAAVSAALSGEDA